MTMQDSIFAARKSGPLPQADGANLFEFQFDTGDPTFAGHFPGRPILPGVYQLELARVAAGMILNCPLKITEIRKAKFQRPILPGEVVRVALKLMENNGTIEVRANFSVGGQAAGETTLFLCREK